MDTIRIELDKTDMRQLKEFAEDFDKDLREALEHVAEKAKDFAVQNTPEDEGTMRGAYWTEVEGSGAELDAWVGNTARTAHLVEFGYKKHFAPFRFAPRLKAWAERKGLPVDNLWGLELEKPKRTEDGYVITPAIDRAGDLFDAKLFDEVEKRWSR